MVPEGRKTGGVWSNGDNVTAPFAKNRSFTLVLTWSGLQMVTVEKIEVGMSCERGGGRGWNWQRDNLPENIWQRMGVTKSRVDEEQDWQRGDESHRKKFYAPINDTVNLESSPSDAKLSRDHARPFIKLFFRLAHVFLTAFSTRIFLQPNFNV